MSNYSESYFDKSNENTSWYKAFNLTPQGSKVLDIGCSSGNFGEVLINERGCSVDGIEISDEDYNEAKSKLNNVYKLNIETDNLDELKGKYDIVYLGDVIEHLVNPVTALEKVSTVLKSTGRLVFSVPNMAHIGVRLDLMQGRFEYTKTGLLDNTHLHYYDRVEIERVIGEAGYKLEKLDYVEKDYPRIVIDKALTEIGLTADDKFYELAMSPEAAAFQWVGIAKYTGEKNIPERKTFGPIDRFELLLNDLNSSHGGDTEALHEEITELRAIINNQQNTINEFKKHPFKVAGRHIKNKLKSN